MTRKYHFDRKLYKVSAITGWTELGQPLTLPKYPSSPFPVHPSLSQKIRAKYMVEHVSVDAQANADSRSSISIFQKLELLRQVLSYVEPTTTSSRISLVKKL